MAKRLTRAKQTTREWRDMVDLIPEDTTIRQATDPTYRYVGVDTTTPLVMAYNGVPVGTGMSTAG